MLKYFSPFRYYLLIILRIFFVVFRNTVLISPFCFMVTFRYKTASNITCIPTFRRNIEQVRVAFFSRILVSIFKATRCHIPDDDSIKFLCSLTLRPLMSYIYGAPILDVSRSHTTTQHSR